ncbi:hypothetical protein CEUSTIGMA_g11695.t1 [Chlamydomonas eustigma]|uniref:Generative cell specific-1/HAP2 domain-containing protein n=1 Tax=Chlamydomonas eustigma TaxID=1157962 RepID=A0A250XMY5_9CHLO|nr:hypothetical protein CEUSTIGMA_g11695.t1 [Chlamydomonas eustigma]|eukprot:GAX84272.1 hypothetical protein CEUSTIGMA_g11695.t1 [Chlamydomonas eustigma]
MAVNNVSGSGQQVLPSGSLPLSSPLTGMNGTNSSSSGTSSGGSNNTAYVLHEEQLSLSPSVPLAVTASGLLSINLVGDLVTYTALPVLSSQLLLIPQPTGASIQQILDGNRSGWMLLSLDMVDTTDTECNKVGTEFSAFFNQPDACYRAPQTCLSNQLKDLQQSDIARVQAGLVPLYMVAQFTDGDSSELQSFNSGPLSFALPVASTSTSLLVISVVADHVVFVENSSPGKINAAAVCQYANTRCGGFEAGASRGYLVVNLTNTGYLNASYTLTFSNCSADIMPVEARQFDLLPGQPTILEPPSEIYVQDNLAAADRYCWLKLFNGQGVVTDEMQVFFYTNATKFNAIPTGGLNGTALWPLLCCGLLHHESMLGEAGWILRADRWHCGTHCHPGSAPQAWRAGIHVQLMHVRLCPMLCCSTSSVQG